MEAGNIFYKIEPDSEKIHVKLDGPAIFSNAYVIEKFLTPFAERGYELFLDFSEVNYIDSTFLGILTLLSQKTTKKINIVNISEHTLNYFKTMHIHIFFNFIKIPDYNTNDFVKIKATAMDRKALEKDILDAHKELLKHNPDKKEKLERVVDIILKSFED